VAELTLILHAVDVDERTLVDPTVFVRLSTPDGMFSAASKVELRGEAVRLRFPDGPSGPSLILRVTPSRYHDGLVTCTVNGSGVVTPTARIRLPKRPSEWRPAFASWHLLAPAFDGLKRVLTDSRVFRVGENSTPAQFVDAAYDAVAPDDDSRVFAKVSLLNLYSRLRDEPVPDLGAPWFSLLRELFVATRERIIAEVTETCWASVTDLAQNARLGYKPAPIGSHKANLEKLSGASALRDFASIKTAVAKANLQLTVARGTRNGSPAFVLDADIDENGRLLPHFFDLIKHRVTRGTHPIDIHESLRVQFPGVDLGYLLEPRLLVGDVRVRVLPASVVLALPVAPSPVGPLPSVTRIAVLGDSVPWGQGLLEVQKVHTLVAQTVSGGAVAFPTTRMMAHSGATIGAGVPPQMRPPVHGEVPRAHPTILEQCESYPADEASQVDLVILNGGINDVDIRFILNPFTEAEDLADTAARACGTDLEVLLRKVGARFPSARVVVTEYYPILSGQSRFSWGLEFLAAAGAPPPPVAMMASPAAAFSIWDRIVDNCQIFHTASSQAARAAVARVNLGDVQPRFVAVDPGFREENAALAPHAWLFGVNWDLSPQDPQAPQRRQACDLHEPDLLRREQCYRASAGHPNALGAQAYANAVIAALPSV
jgi:lysophospholipase L1-like esterase